MAPGPIKLSAFGGLSLRDPDGAELPVAGRKALALVTYLSLSPGMSASRDKLSDLLWSDRRGEQARNSLRQTLTVLRRELGPRHCDLIVARRDVVALAPDLLSADARTFLASAAVRTTESLEKAAALYTGPFLDGFFAGAGEFEEWAAAERDRFVSLAVETLDDLARRAGPKAGLVHARRLLAIDPTREATYRLLMELSAAAGHRDKALHLYETCRDMMRRVFGVEPSAETVALRGRIATSADFAAPRGNGASAPVAKTAPVERMPTVRVHNLVNLTDAADLDGLARGFTDEIITALLRQRGVVVLSERPSAAPETSAPNGEARYVLSGSVQTAAGRIRVNAQLIDVASGNHVWAERYDGGAADALDLQDRAAQSIALATWHELLMVRWSLHDRAPADEPEVRLLVRRAMVKYFEFTQESLTAAIDLAEQALRLDKDSPRALRALSLCITAGIAQGALRSSEEATTKALRLAERAVGMVPDDEYGRCILAWAMANAGRSIDAVAELKHAIALNPNYPTSRSDLAEQYAILGRSTEAIAAAQESLRLGSVGPIDFWRHYGMAVAHFAAASYAEALDNARRVLTMKPGLIRGALFLAAAAAAVDEADEAAAAIALCCAKIPDLRLADVAPGILPRYVQDEHHQRFIAMLRKAGLPE